MFAYKTICIGRLGIRGAHVRQCDEEEEEEEEEEEKEEEDSSRWGKQEFSRVADPANIQRIRQTVAGSRDTVYCTGAPLKCFRCILRRA